MRLTYVLLNPNSNFNNCSEYNPQKKRFWGVWAFYHQHGLELPTHGDNKKQTNLQSVLLFLISLQTLPPLRADTPTCIPLHVGPASIQLPWFPTPNLSTSQAEIHVSQKTNHWCSYSGGPLFIHQAVWPWDGFICGLRHFFWNLKTRGCCPGKLTGWLEAEASLRRH